MDLSNFSGISELFTKCFDEVESVTKAPKKSKAIAYTQPRGTAASFRDAVTQAGIVTSEDGSVEISSGRPQGSTYNAGAASSIVLRADGSIVIVAPAGINILGPTKQVGIAASSGTSSGTTGQAQNYMQTAQMLSSSAQNL